MQHNWFLHVIMAEWKFIKKKKKIQPLVTSLKYNSLLNFFNFVTTVPNKQYA